MRGESPNQFCCWCYFFLWKPRARRSVSGDYNIIIPVSVNRVYKRALEILLRYCDRYYTKQYTNHNTIALMWTLSSKRPHERDPPNFTFSQSANSVREGFNHRITIHEPNSVNFLEQNGDSKGRELNGMSVNGFRYLIKSKTRHALKTVTRKNV